MSLPFVRTKPLQALKLVAIVTTSVFAAAGVAGYVPSRGFIGLFLIVALALGLALVIVLETIRSSYLALVSSESLSELMLGRPLYSAARVIELLSAVFSIGGIWILIASIPDGPMAGPGAIGLLFLLTRRSLVVLGGSFVRTLVEIHEYRRPGI